MFEQIRSNQRRSAVLVVGMAALLLGFGYALGEIVAPGAGGGGLLVAFALWVILTLVAYFRGDAIFLRMSGARQIEQGDFPLLFNVVEEMKIASGLPRMLRIYVIDDPSPNAFATGRRPEDAAVAVTTGLLERLDRDELQGVIAHEIGHIRNRDILFMMMVGVMMGSIVMLADVAARAMFYGRAGRRTSSRRGGGGGGQAVVLLVGLLLVILAPILAQMIYFACSRKREYLADASGALFTRYPEGLASALEKISSGVARRPMASVNRVTAPMFIVSPLGGFVSAFASAAVGLFSTHPPTSERVRVLRSMGGAALADYEKAWRSSHGGRGLMRESTWKSGAAVEPRARTAPPDTPDAHATRARASTDLMWSLGGFSVIPCPCGAKIKIPPGFAHPHVTCPRCRTRHARPPGRR